MARIRSVHPRLFTDEVYMAMSLGAKAMWPAIWTECDDHGIFEWKPIVLKARLSPADNLDFSQILAEWEAAGCVRRVEIDGRPYGIVRNFRKYQRPKRPTYIVDMPSEFRTFIGITEECSEHVPDEDVTGQGESIQKEGKKEGRKEGREEGIKERKMAQSAPPPSLPSDPETQLFDRGKQVLGKNAGGLIAKLLKAKGGNIPLARAAIEQASTKQDACEYVGRIINQQTGPPLGDQYRDGMI